jgi:hypothetical protein
LLPHNNAVLSQIWLGMKVLLPLGWLSRKVFARDNQIRLIAAFEHPSFNAGLTQKKRTLNRFAFF